jgi:hypothetical protein
LGREEGAEEEEGCAAGAAAEVAPERTEAAGMVGEGRWRRGGRGGVGEMGLQRMHWALSAPSWGEERGRRDCAGELVLPC